ncbi:MAG TPA: four helix bundle protein [Candidatus Paceibacterota bacterium]|nr:four helix bundle protein [Candidatus Paceibacterota bacterium]HRZ91423.1 four helix bundle protein [Candidatus Paceibacterota bacterium]
MNEQEMKARTKKFALRTIELVLALPQSEPGRVIGHQLMKSGTSVGANYRSACRGKSKPDFIAKLAIALEEADECGYWLELLTESGLMKETLIQPLWKEADELCAIFSSSLTTAKPKI